jgi:hypothetical protein
MAAGPMEETRRNTEATTVARRSGEVVIEVIV